MKVIYDKLSNDICKKVTRRYSTSFSVGIFMLHQSLHEAIYSIYGFVRLADEIVDTFHEFDKGELLQEFKEDTFEAIANGISLNPVLHAFQYTVNKYGILHDHIRKFFESMAMDLEKSSYARDYYAEYIDGSAEVVGLMCLKVFVHEKPGRYTELEAPARRLGAAFQKVNFLRDLGADYHQLGRTYFPNMSVESFSEEFKNSLESEIQQDFDLALDGIKKLPPTSRAGVYTAYVYYRNLFHRITREKPQDILNKRIRVPNRMKVLLLVKSYLTIHFTRA